MSVGHYENFPVGSILLPRRMRRAVHVIYHFARYADDVAEGNKLPEERLRELAHLRDELDVIRDGGIPAMPLMRNLASRHQPPSVAAAAVLRLAVGLQPGCGENPLSELCRTGGLLPPLGQPGGRLMLALYGENDPRSLAMSDGICTALQLINFLQDVGVDWNKGRIYIPLDDLEKFRIREGQIAGRDATGLWRPMMLAQIERTRKMLQAGAPLGKVLKGRLGLELRLSSWAANAF
jgi:phytoene/squalene synthetase